MAQVGLVNHIERSYQRLVRRPLRPASLTALVSDQGTSGAATTQENPDGSQLAWSLTAPAVTTSLQSSAEVQTTLYGSIVGVRWKRTSTRAPFTLVVDGVGYAVRNTSFRRHAATTLSSDDFEGRFWVEGLDPTVPHFVQVIVAGQPVGGSSQTISLFGWLVDRAEGYEDTVRLGVLPTATIAVPTSLTRITGSGNGNGATGRINLVNTSGSARRVTFTQGLTDQVINTIDLAATGSAGDSYEWKLDPPVALMSQNPFKWMADSSGVNGWIAER